MSVSAWVFLTLGLWATCGGFAAAAPSISRQQARSVDWSKEDKSSVHWSSEKLEDRHLPPTENGGSVQAVHDATNIKVVERQPEKQPAPSLTVSVQFAKCQILVARFHFPLYLRFITTQRAPAEP